MQFFVGIDVSLESSSICVIDERGIIIKEGKVESDPQSVAKFIRHKGRKIEHVGLEAGQLSEWLFVGLSKEGFKVSVLESRHVRAAFAAMRVKTDRNDARGIAQLIRLGWFKSVHVKTLNARETRYTSHFAWRPPCHGGRLVRAPALVVMSEREMDQERRKASFERGGVHSDRSSRRGRMTLRGQPHHNRKLRQSRRSPGPTHHPAPVAVHSQGLEKSAVSFKALSVPE